MDQFERMKVTRQAMNGRMCLMFGGIFLMFSAITSTIMYGINFFMTALEADKGTAEYVELLENAGVGSGLSERDWYLFYCSRNLGSCSWISICKKFQQSR